MSYSAEAAAQIRLGFQEKGWNLYLKRGPPGRMDPAETVERGPAGTLNIDGRYVMLPVVDDPTNLELITITIDEMAERRKRRLQTITLKGVPRDVTGLSLYKDGLKVHCPEGLVVSYEELVRALPTLTDARSS